MRRIKKRVCLSRAVCMTLYNIFNLSNCWYWWLSKKAWRTLISLKEEETRKEIEHFVYKHLHHDFSSQATLHLGFEWGFSIK